MPKERLRQHTGEHSLDTPVAVQHRVSMVAGRHIPPITNEKGRSSQTVIDRMVQEAERCQDENETNKAKTEAKNGMEKYCVTGRKTAIEGEPKLKLEAGNEEKIEKAVRDARNWLDKNRLAENDEFEAQQKELEEVPADMMTSRQVPAAQLIKETCETPHMAVNMPVAAQHQVPTVQRVETTVGGPKVQFINEVVDVPAFKQRRVSTAMQTDQKTDQTVEVARVIPHERILKPAGERASVRERVRQFEMNGESEDPEDEAPNKRRTQESYPDPRAPVHFSLWERSQWMTLETRPRGEREGAPVE